MTKFLRILKDSFMWHYNEETIPITLTIPLTAKNTKHFQIQKLCISLFIDKSATNHLSHTITQSSPSVLRTPRDSASLCLPHKIRLGHCRRDYFLLLLSNNYSQLPIGHNRSTRWPDEVSLYLNVQICSSVLIHSYHLVPPGLCGQRQFIQSSSQRHNPPPGAFQYRSCMSSLPDFVHLLRSCLFQNF